MYEYSEVGIFFRVGENLFGFSFATDDKGDHFQPQYIYFFVSFRLSFFSLCLYIDWYLFEYSGLS